MKWKSIRKNMQWLTKFNVYILLIRSLLNKTAIVFVSLETAKRLQITGEREVARSCSEDSGENGSTNDWGEIRRKWLWVFYRLLEGGRWRFFGNVRDIGNYLFTIILLSLPSPTLSWWRSNSSHKKWRRRRSQSVNDQTPIDSSRRELSIGA